MALDETQRAALIEDIGDTAGTAAGSVRKLAARHGVSTATVRRVAKAAGLNDAWSRDATKKATESKQADLGARLVAQASRNAGVAEQILASFEAMELADWLAVSPHSRGIVLGILQDKALALVPADDEGQEQRRSAVADLFELMRSTAAR